MKLRMAAITGWGITCFCYDTLLFFVMVMFGLCSGNRIHQSMHHALSRPFLVGSDNTIISYYSHKKSYFGKIFLQKNEVINAVYTERRDITEDFVKECLIKVHTFFVSMCGKSQLGE